MCSPLPDNFRSPSVLLGQASSLPPPSESQSTSSSLHHKPTTAAPLPLQARSELWSEALADASPDCLHHSLSDIRLSPHVSYAPVSKDAAKSCPVLQRSDPHKRESLLLEGAVDFRRTQHGNQEIASSRDSSQRVFAAIDRLQRALSGKTSRHSQGPPPRDTSQAPPLGEKPSSHPTHASSLSPVQAPAKDSRNHRVFRSTPPQNRPAHTPPRSNSAHFHPIPSQVAAAHAQPYRGEDTEDLSGFNFAPPPAPKSSLPRPSSVERNLAYSNSLPAKGRGVGNEEGGQAAAAHDAHDHVGALSLTRVNCKLSGIC